jgi:sterol desaturase/sphingolipid hydroxylase (fatty acid hydroxylase superfamily)
MKDKGVYRGFFLHVDIIVMAFTFFVIAGITIIKGISWSVMVFFLIGLITFMLGEYLTHRFLFHLEAPKNPFFLKILKRLHYDHHQYPNDLKLMFLPIWYSIPNISGFSIVFYFISRNLHFTLAFSLGLILMLLIYEWKHFVAHRPIKPRTGLGLWLKKTHILHHYKNENYWYGVSTPIFDYVFGTFRDEKEVESSQTAKDLEKRAK